VEAIDTAALLTLESDDLVPAALENRITAANAADVRARIVVEGASGPTTAAADRALEERGVVVVPGILANGGGVTVSGFEWVQDRMGCFSRESEMHERLEDDMVRAFDDVASMAAPHGVSRRIAAHVVAIQRVARDLETRGLYA